MSVTKEMVELAEDAKELYDYALELVAERDRLQVAYDSRFERCKRLAAELDRLRGFPGDESPADWALRHGLTGELYEGITKAIIDGALDLSGKKAN